MKNRSLKFISIITLTLLAVILTGCISLDGKPSEIVKNFVFSRYYILMSEEYKQNVSETDFEAKINECKPEWKHYEFIEVINETIEGNIARVEIKYKEKYDGAPLDTFTDIKTDTILLVKENNGWRLQNLNCKLVGKP